MADATDLQGALCLLICTFNKYAKGDGQGRTLSKAEAKTMLQTEMPHMKEACSDPATMDTLLKNLDTDGDSEMNFQEFMIMMASMACLLQECIQ